MNNNSMIKLLVMGDANVGKSSLIKCFTGQFQMCQKLRTDKHSMDFTVCKTIINCIQHKIQIWIKTYHENKKETFRAIRMSKPQGVILVYDVTDIKSFYNMVDCVFQIKYYVDDDIPIIIVGNKNDLLNKKLISFDEGKNMADSLGYKFYESSTKISILSPIDDIFIALIQDILNASIKKTDVKQMTNNYFDKYTCPIL